MAVAASDAALVFAGGGAGAVARWLVSSWLQRYSELFPLGTLAVNVLGSLLLGFIMGAALAYGVFTRWQRLLLATGFAGGFTTFSTFSYESLRLLVDSPLLGLANLAANVLGGLLAAYLGYVAAGVVYGRALA